MNVYQEYKIQIKMFGTMQVENQFGLVKEPGRESEAWKILKYLLVKRGVSVSQEEMQKEIWNESPENSYNSFRTRLSRLRSAFKDIKLGGTKGLILCDNGICNLNPEYDIQTDADLFDTLMDRIRTLPVDDPEGLALCASAIELYRGVYLERTEAHWLEGIRKHYQEEFKFLTHSALERKRVLNNTAVAKSLSSRVEDVMPEQMQLQEEIRRFVAEAKVPLQIERMIANNAPVRDVRLRMFGLLELEDQYGRIGEVQGQLSQPWLLLKYLLVNRGRGVCQAELLEQVWADSRIDTEKNGEGTIRVYLSRLRQLLKPLHMDGRNGLVIHEGGFYDLNPDFEIQTDEDLFWRLMDRIQKTPSDDPHGLLLCVEALKLFRGKFLENTEERPWILERRDRYSVEFCFLACSTLERMEILQDTSAVLLLSQRAIAIMPEEEPLHKEIIRFMIEHDLQAELVHHVSQLARVQTAEANWLMGQGKGDAEGVAGPLSEWIYSEQDVRIREFGVLALDNRWGHVEENLRRGRTEIDEDRPRLAWKLFKYLLVNRGRDVPQNELIENVWPRKPDVDDKNVCVLRRRRMRENLEPLRLHGPHGLILFSEEDLYSLNPQYNLITDADLFAGYLEQARSSSIEDPAGLEACVKALELYRGEFMQYTADAPWLIKFRKHYYDELCYLVHDTLRRMKTLGDAGAVGLLSRRVAAFMPAAKELHMELISYMMEQNRQEELEQYIALLVHHGGEGACWLDA